MHPINGVMLFWSRALTSALASVNPKGFLVNQHSNGISPGFNRLIHLQRIHFHCHVSSPVWRISFLIFLDKLPDHSNVNQSKSEYQVLDFGLSGKKKMVPHLNGRQKTSSLRNYWSLWCDFRDLQISGIPRVPWTDVQSVCHKPAHLITSATMDEWLYINLESSQSFMNKINQSINKSIHPCIHPFINQSYQSISVHRYV